MNYVENIYICIAAPIVVAILSVKGQRRQMMASILAGMTACLLSSYISSFLTVIYKVSKLEATMLITPMVEELMKFLPVLFYLLLFEPDNKEESAGDILLVAVGFTTFENICYLTANGASQIFLLIVRALSCTSLTFSEAVLIQALPPSFNDPETIRSCGAVRTPDYSFH